MKVAIGTANYGLDSQTSEIFGRSKAFIIVDLEEGKIENITEFENTVKHQSGAGNTAGQFMIDKNVDVLISGKLGPTAFHIMRNAGIKVYKAAPRTADINLKRFMEGKLEEVTSLSGGFPV